MSIPMTKVKAEEAPIGVQLWPTRLQEYAPNFTLAEVQVIRNEIGTYVRWVYQGDVETRTFKVGEEVAVMLMQCPECGHGLMMPAPKGQPGDDSYYCEGCGRAETV